MELEFCVSIQRSTQEEEGEEEKEEEGRLVTDENEKWVSSEEEKKLSGQWNILEMWDFFRSDAATSEMINSDFAVKFDQVALI